METRFARSVAPLLLATLMVGCATTANRPSPTANLPGKDTCLFRVDVRSWEVLDDSTLLVQAPNSKDQYLFKLFAPITGLAFHEALGFEDGDHNGMLCSTGDDIIVRGPVPQRAPIVAVRLLSSDEVKQLRASYKKT